MTNDKYSDMGAATTSGTDFKPLEAQSYDFVIHGIVGLGLRPNSFQGEVKAPVAQIKVIFELPDAVRDDGQTSVVGC